LNLGYALSTVIFLACFIIAATAQIRTKSFHRFLYWTVIVATTTVGTTMADFANRSLGIGYAGGSLILFAGLMLVLGLWWLSVRTISFRDIASPKVAIFYWTTILFSTRWARPLVTDWRIRQERDMSAGGALTLVAAAYFFTKTSRTLLFWTAFILTRPLGATLGDILTKPLANGGLNFSRIISSLVIAGFVVFCIFAHGAPSGKAPRWRWKASRIEISTDTQFTCEPARGKIDGCECLR
jgi:uncharacterized membrane-anchored protein